MLPGIHIRDLEVYGYGMFHDILNIMDTLDVEELTREDAIRYRDRLRERARKRPALVKDTIRGGDKEKPCKGCKDKKEGG